MAAKKIESDDLILVNRGGVDYQAKVSDLPIEDVDLDGYATEKWVEAKGYITSDEVPETPELDGYATEEWVEDWVEDKGYITSEGVDLDGYATEEWVEAKGYITSDGDGSTLTGVMPLDLRTLPTLS